MLIFEIFLICCTFLVTNCKVDDDYYSDKRRFNHEKEAKIETKKPYRFGYEIQDKDGNLQHRHEQSDANGVRRGSYGYLDANGIYRQVEYIADENGFRVNLKSNEPGIEQRKSADVNVIPLKTPPPSAPLKHEETLTPHKTESHISKEYPDFVPVIHPKAIVEKENQAYDTLARSVELPLPTYKPKSSAVGNAYKSTAHLQSRDNHLNEAQPVYDPHKIYKANYKPPYDLNYNNYDKIGYDLKKTKSSVDPYQVNTRKKFERENYYRPKTPVKIIYHLPPQVFYDDVSTEPPIKHEAYREDSLNNHNAGNYVDIYEKKPKSALLQEDEKFLYRLKTVPRYHSVVPQYSVDRSEKPAPPGYSTATAYPSYGDRTIGTFKRGLRGLVPYIDKSASIPYGGVPVPENFHSDNSSHQKVTLLLIDPKYAKYSDLEGLAAKSYPVKAVQAPVYKD